MTAENEQCREVDPGAHPTARGSRCVLDAPHTNQRHQDAFGEEFGSDYERRTRTIDGHVYVAVTLDGATDYYKNGFSIRWAEGAPLFESEPRA